MRRLVHVSSIHALEQRPLDRPVDEDRPLADEHPARGLPPYDRSKAAGERLVREASAAGLDAVILNPTGMFGPFDFKPSLFGRVLIALANGRAARDRRRRVRLGRRPGRGRLGGDGRGAAGRRERG